MLCKKALNDTYVLPLLGSIAFIVGLILFSVAKRIWLLYIGKVIVIIVSLFTFYCFFSLILLAVCLESLFFLALPILRTKLTKLVKINEYAIVFIAAGVVETIGHQGIGAVANDIYKASLQFFPGLIFLVFAIIGVFPIVIMMYDCF
jgi:hypothetical protein